MYVMDGWMDRSMSTKKGFINYLKYKYQATYISSMKSDQDAYVFFFFFFHWPAMGNNLVRRATKLLSSLFRNDQNCT